MYKNSEKEGNPIQKFDSTICRLESCIKFDYCDKKQIHGEKQRCVNYYYKFNVIKK